MSADRPEMHAGGFAALLTASDMIGITVECYAGGSRRNLHVIVKIHMDCLRGFISTFHGDILLGLHTILAVRVVQNSRPDVSFVSFAYGLVQRTVEHAACALGRTGRADHALCAMDAFCRRFISAHLLLDPAPAIVKAVLEHRSADRMERNARRHLALPVDMKGAKPCGTGNLALRAEARRDIVSAGR